MCRGQFRKDGPSAGAAIATALAPAMFRQANGCYDREITLRGRVHEIGGVKEKLSRHIGGNKDDRLKK